MKEHNGSNPTQSSPKLSSQGHPEINSASSRIESPNNKKMPQVEVLNLDLLQRDSDVVDIIVE